MSLNSIPSKIRSHCSNHFYIYITAIFAIWVIFFDSNSLLEYRKLSGDVLMLKYEKKFYTDEIAKLQKRYDAFHSEDKFEIEKYAREHFHMRKPGEYMYIYDDETSN